MIERYDKRPHISAVAVFANIRCWYVIHGLTARDRTVVATKTIRRDAGVVELYDRREANGHVTVFALIACGNVIERFAQCDLIVVAADALADNFVVIHTVDRNETASRMTGFAAIARHDVSRRFRRRRDEPAVRMAVLALPARAGENATVVTIAATCRRMRAVKHEAGRIVIEV